MNGIFSKRLAAGATATLLACSAIAATVTPVTTGAAGSDPNAAAGQTGAASAATAQIDNWGAPQYLNLPAGVTTSPSMKLSGSPAAKTQWTLSGFVPITPCRLVDTRGAFSPVYGGPAFAANEVRNYVIPGHCGVPAGTGHIDGVSLQITTPPTAASGDIEVIATGQTLGGTVAMVIQAGQWNSVSDTSGVNAAGSIQVQLRSTPGDVVIDINGYYADTNSAQDDVFAISGTHSGGGVLFVTTANSGGSAINGYNSATSAQAELAFGTNALHIVSGGIRVQGAGLNTNATAFVHKVNTASSLCPGFPAYSIINNQYTNNNPTASLIITPVEYYNSTTGATGTAFGGVYSGTFVAYYAGAGVCGAGNVWTIRRSDNTPLVDGMGFNVLVLQP